jgi:hypothetical protein
MTSQNNLFFNRAAQRQQTSNFPIQQEQNQPKENPFFKRAIQKQKPIESDYQSDEETQRQIERSQAQITSRAMESVLGLPGDITNFVGGLFGFEPGLPGSQDFKNLSESLTLGYTKPQNEFEETIGETFQDIALMALPGARHYSFARNLGIPIVGNLAKQGLKYSNADEKTQAYSKIGTMISLDLLSGRKFTSKAYINDLFNKAEEAIPKGLSIDAKGLEKSLLNLEKELNRGGARPSTKKALEKINEIKKDIRNGKVEAKTLAAYRPSINEIIDEVGGFNLEIPAKLRPSTIKNLNQVKSETIKTLEKYGEKFNPEYLKYSRSANEAYAAMQNSNKIAKFIQKQLPYSPQSQAVQSLFHIAPYAAGAALSKLSPLTGAGAIAGYAGYQGFKVLHRVMNSPTLSKYYLNTLKYAAQENIPKTIENLQALDKAMQDQKGNDSESSSSLGGLKIK